MPQSQKKFDVNISFDDESVQYLMEAARLQSKTIAEVVEDLVKEEIEADMEFSKIADDRLSEGQEEVEDDENIWK
jgi:hypothetical protein